MGSVARQPPPAALRQGRAGAGFTRGRLVSGLILRDLATGPDSKLIATQRLAALGVGHFMGEEPDCSPSLGALSEWTGLSVATVKRALDVLTAPDGFLEKVPGVGRYSSPTYRLRTDVRGVEPAHRESERATAPKRMAPTKKGPSPSPSPSPKRGATATVVMSQAPTCCPDCGGDVAPPDVEGVYRCLDQDALDCLWSGRILVEVASNAR
jgi:hypothetical protein